MVNITKEKYVTNLKTLTEHTQNLSASILVSATYDGYLKKAVLKLYNPQTKKIHFWYDDSNHKELSTLGITKMTQSQQSKNKFNKTKTRFINHAQSDNPTISKDELKSLLEAKYQQGEISKEIYTDILEDFHDFD